MLLITILLLTYWIWVVWASWCDRIWLRGIMGEFCHTKNLVEGQVTEKSCLGKLLLSVGDGDISSWVHKALGVRLTQWAFKKGLWRGEFYHPLTIPKRGTSPKDTMTNSRNLFMPAVAGDIGCVMENYIIRKYLKIRPIKTVWSSWLILTLWLI